MSKPRAIHFQFASTTKSQLQNLQRAPLLKKARNEEIVSLIKDFKESLNN